MADRKAAEQFIETGTKAALDKSSEKNIQHAYQMFTSACYADPTFDQTWYSVGNANSDMNLLDAAIACYRRALECKQSDENRARTLTNLGWRLHGLGQSQEALDVSLEATKLKPDLWPAWVNLSMIWGTIYETQKGVEAAERAFKIAPKECLTEMALAFANLFAGNYSKGLMHFERRFEYKLHQFLHYPYGKWLGQKDKTVFLVADQGLGDTLSYARFLPMAAAKCKFMYISIQAELMRLFQYSFRHINNITFLPMPCNFPAADYWTTFVSLPFAMKMTDEEIKAAGNFDTDTHVAPDTWKVENRKLHVGIAWSGSPLNEINGHRSIPIKHFMELAAVPGVQLYSFQVDDAKRQLHEGGYSPIIRDLSGYIRDVADSMALMRHLDLVVTCESAVGHIAGAIAKECIIPYSYLGRDYRLGDRGDRILWYGFHSTVQQGPYCRWEPVFETIAARLRARVSC